jgi:ParB family chromosome partitioning protein
MTESATAQRPPTQVEYLDPKTLILDRNVRFDPRLDKEFVASIKARGVLVPIVAVRTTEGGVKVRMGGRRTLGAIEAERAEVPVMVVADERTDDAGEIDRIVDQWAENHHRAPLTDLEDVGAVAQLLDLGLTAGQIQRKMHMPKPRFQAVTAVAGSELARAAAARYEFLTLEQSAAVAEFEDDTEAVKALVAAAQMGPVRFDHVVSRLRRDRDEEKAKAEVTTTLEAAGVRVVEEIPWEWAIEHLTDADGNDLTVENHETCPGHAAMLDWGEADDGSTTWEPVPVCTEPSEHDHHSKVGYRLGGEADGTTTSEPAATAAEEAAAERAEAKRAARRTVIDNNKAWRAAEEVRRDWLKQFFKRKTAPKGAARWVLEELAKADWQLTNKLSGGSLLACSLLGISLTPEALQVAMSRASDAHAQMIAVAIVLSAYEDHTSVETWRTPMPQNKTYFAKLVEFGYQLSDIEASVVGEEAAA